MKFVSLEQRRRRAHSMGAAMGQGRPPLGVESVAAKLARLERELKEIKSASIGAAGKLQEVAPVFRGGALAGVGAPRRDLFAKLRPSFPLRAGPCNQRLRMAPGSARPRSWRASAQLRLGPCALDRGLGEPCVLLSACGSERREKCKATVARTSRDSRLEEARK